MSFKLPLICGHRGYKGKYPENTIMGFQKCLETGAESFETDLYLTIDDVLVVSHDVNTKRTYSYPNGDEADFYIPKSSYENDLKGLVNKKTGDKLLTFKTLCEFLVDTENIEQKVIMLDIKTYNRAVILKNIFQEMLAVKNDINYWFKLFQFGVWDLEFIKFCNQDSYFQEVYENYDIKVKCQIYHISANWKFSLSFLGYNDYLDQIYGNSRHLYKTTGVSLIYILTWSKDFLEEFMPLVKIHNLGLWTWTVNNTFQYDYFNQVCKSYSVGFYGIMSDDPGHFVEYRDSHKEIVKEDMPLIESKVSLTLTQRIANSCFSFFVSFVKLPSPDFGSPANLQLREVKIGSFVRNLFAFLQRLGIF